MSKARLTLMAVHAHPDDEATSTGGIIARYAEEGVRVVLVTCTDGSMGDGPGGSKPGDALHDPAAVVATRRGELERSCAILGVSDLELLGYPDSGMAGWAGNDDPSCFWQAPVPVVSARLGELMARYRPQVVVTYDPTGFYGHPDHIQAHRITVAAFDATAVADKLYFPALSRGRMERFASLVPAFAARDETAQDDADAEGGHPYVVEDEEISAVIDCKRWVELKRDALAAHGSQLDNSWLLDLGPHFADLFGEETFVRARDRTGVAVPEHDLFAGLR